MTLTDSQVRMSAARLIAAYGIFVEVDEVMAVEELLHPDGLSLEDAGRIVEAIETADVRVTWHGENCECEDGCGPD